MPNLAFAYATSAAIEGPAILFGISLLEFSRVQSYLISGLMLTSERRHNFLPSGTPSLDLE